MKSINIISQVSNGNLTRNRTRIKDAIATFEGKDVSITIKKKRKTRSNSQNQYYWGVVLELTIDAIKKEWGEIWDKDNAHEFLKSRFLYYEKYNENTGEIIKTPKSTTECSTVEYEEYLSQCRQFLKEWFNTDIPLPNEEITLNF